MKKIVMIFFVTMFSFACYSQKNIILKNDSTKLILKPFNFYSTCNIKDSVLLFNNAFNTRKRISSFDLYYATIHEVQTPFYSFYNYRNNSIFLKDYNNYNISNPDDFIIFNKVHLPYELFILMGKGLNHLFH